MREPSVAEGTRWRGGVVRWAGRKKGGGCCWRGGVGGGGGGGIIGGQGGTGGGGGFFICGLPAIAVMVGGCLCCVFG